MKKRVAVLTAACMAMAAFTSTAYAYVFETSDRPYDRTMVADYTVVSRSILGGSSSSAVVGEPGSGVIFDNPDGGYGVSSPAPSLQQPSSGSAVGSMYNSEPIVTMDLGFTLVSPTYTYGNFKVAEGSVQLSDGSWAYLGHDSVLRGAYYRLLREETDSTGKGWYVVEAHASNVGDYFTPDGSIAEELWLVKNECTASSTFSLNTSDPVRQNIVRTALSLLGLPYANGATGPDSFDCSGFVNYVMRQNGINLPRTSDEICNAGTEVGIEGLRPGDIVGRPGHVGIYIGGGYFVHASETNTGVIVESVDVYNTVHTFTNYRSVVN